MALTPLAALQDCCEQVLQGDAATLQALQAAGFDCRVGYWAFGLPELYRHLGGGDDASYRRWLQQLYAGDLNTRLRELGAEIAILDNRGKVALNRYCLRRLAD
ncbi:hypothetical protein JQX08_02110 [Pseudomonas sp. UL073]|uniref:Uncharacterized protein n=1 Tax=Zestomonas insulae TaxID=2809017 RepID=A0ABS2I8L7_9GAMM|nr:hypothetical protein [Pseudomonas insulae]MBM7059491.1 hypothetical protein [Pseudomonas insulae]